jgi:hypothetical protein
VISPAADGLADAFDRLEGSLRKFIGDRRMREGDAASRFALASALLAHLELRYGVRWPLPDSQGEAIDFAGLDAQGRPVAGVARAELGLAGLGPVLDAWVALVPRLPAIFARSSGVLSLERPALVVAAERLDAPAARILACLDADLRSLEASRRGREPSFVLRALPELAAGAPLHRTPAFSRPVEPVEATPFVAGPRRTPPPAPRDETPEPAIEVSAPPRESQPGEAPSRRRFEELSVFDLGEGAAGDDAAQAVVVRRARRGRGRGAGPGRRRRRARTATAAKPKTKRSPETEAAPEPSSAHRASASERGARRAAGAVAAAASRCASARPKPSKSPKSARRTTTRRAGRHAHPAGRCELEIPEPVYEEEEGRASPRAKRTGRCGASASSAAARVWRRATPNPS